MNPDRSIDELLHALADTQRRLVFQKLASESPPEVTVEALEEAVVQGLEPPATQHRSSASVAIQLRHVHLPVLDDAGLCNYDPERECVEYCADEFAESLLALIEDDPSPGQVH